ncbi:MAG: GTPase Era [Actinomycetota bacterium]|nr:GTPase Era [Actinomycetota bacterium]
MTEAPIRRSGIVAVVGRPNTGKSTLVNAAVGTKVSIVTDKPQTTRAAVRGVLTSGEVQIVFTDTPGFHKPRTLLGQRLNRTVSESVEQVEAVVLVVDAAAGVGRGDRFVAERQVAPASCLKVCAVNKVDLVKRARLVEQLDLAARLADFDHVVPVSARKGAGVADLVGVLAAAMPEGPAYFPPGQVTDQPEELRIAETVREKALELTREEVPHSVAVQVDELEREDDLLRVRCLVLVERESQKGIVIGKGGLMLKRIGTLARTELEGVLGVRIFLELRVKVLKEWQRDERALAQLGY